MSFVALLGSITKRVLDRNGVRSEFQIADTTNALVHMGRVSVANNVANALTSRPTTGWGFTGMKVWKDDDREGGGAAEEDEDEDDDGDWGFMGVYEGVEGELNRALQSRCSARVQEPAHLRALRCGYGR